MRRFNNQRLSAAPQCSQKARTSIAVDKPCWAEAPLQVVVLVRWAIGDLIQTPVGVKRLQRSRASPDPPGKSPQPANIVVVNRPRKLSSTSRNLRGSWAGLRCGNGVGDCSNKTGRPSWWNCSLKISPYAVKAAYSLGIALRPVRPTMPLPP